jgi:hypothetical protein
MTSISDQNIECPSGNVPGIQEFERERVNEEDLKLPPLTASRGHLL